MTGRDRRAVLFGGVIVAAAWLSLRGGPAVYSFITRTEAQVEQQQLLIDRARARLSRLDQFADSIEVLEAVATALPATLLIGRDRQTAQVDLMQRARKLLAAHSLRIEEFVAGPSAGGEAELTLALLTARIETDFRTLMDVLTEIENDAALGLESVTVEAVDAYAGPGRPEVLRATISMSGWFHPEPAPEEDLGLSFTR